MYRTLLVVLGALILFGIFSPTAEAVSSNCGHCDTEYDDCEREARRNHRNQGYVQILVCGLTSTAGPYWVVTCVLVTQYARDTGLDQALARCGRQKGRCESDCNNAHLQDDGANN